MRAFSIAASLAVLAEATQLSFLKEKKGSQLRKGKPLVTQVNAFGTSQEACCACFKSKYAWPANAALGAAFAPKQTCDTCYAADIYGIPARGPVTFQVPRPLDDGSPPPGECRDICDMYGCGVHVRLPGEKDMTVKQFEGPGACKALVSDVGFINALLGSGEGDVCPIIGSACMTACNINGCGGDSSGAYETTKESKVQAVHEWNWNCASGNAPEDPEKWLDGPVEGEPESSRGPFVMCQEDGGWYCPYEEGPDLKMEAGKDAPKEIEEGGSSTISVATMTLPVIDGGRSVAASVSL